MATTSGGDASSNNSSSRAAAEYDSLDIETFLSDIGDIWLLGRTNI